MSEPARTEARDAGGYREPAARTWPDHAGRPVPDAVYPVPPDPAIGDVVTAWSNVSTRGTRPLPARRLRLVVVGMAALAGTAVFFLGMITTAMLSYLGVTTSWEPYAAWTPFVGVGLAFLARQRPSCTYLGTEGLQEHVRLGLTTRARTLRFADAAALTVAETAQYTNGAYQGTSYSLRFRDREGASVFELAGLRFDHGVWAQEDPYWELARAAIARWSALRWRRLEDEHRDTGEARFRAAGVVLVVADGALRIEGTGPVVTLSAPELESVSVRAGLLVIREVGAKEGLLGSRGVRRYEAGTVEDLELFLRAAQRWGRLSVR
jgi:hypothetical protein